MELQLWTQVLKTWNGIEMNRLHGDFYSVLLKSLLKCNSLCSGIEAGTFGKWLIM